MVIDIDVAATTQYDLCSVLHAELHSTLTAQDIILTHLVHPLCLALASAVAIGACYYTQYTLNMLPSMPLAVWISGSS